MADKQSGQQGQSETIDVIIAFDPDDPKRNETKETLPAAEAYSLIQTGRARLADGGGKKADKAATLS
jgi:hypothetical protein